MGGALGKFNGICCVTRWSTIQSWKCKQILPITLLKKTCNFCLRFFFVQRSTFNSWVQCQKQIAASDVAGNTINSSAKISTIFTKLRAREIIVPNVQTLCRLRWQDLARYAHVEKLRVTSQETPLEFPGPFWFWSLTSDSCIEVTNCPSFLCLEGCWNWLHSKKKLQTQMWHVSSQEVILGLGNLTNLIYLNGYSSK